jgi:flavin reductase (DIM6/NTAB) family NADH-FMN oxidoreductase RutF
MGRRTSLRLGALAKGRRYKYTHMFIFSYFSMVCHNPPLVSVSFSHSPTRQKDTSVNIRETKQFTVNIISEPFVEGANWTSTDAPVTADEWVGSGLTKAESVSERTSCAVDRS